MKVARFSSGGPLEVALSWHNGTGKGVQMLTVPKFPESDLIGAGGESPRKIRKKT